MDIDRIDRKVYQGGREEAHKRVEFCLNMLGKYKFAKGVDWDTLLCKSLSVEEVIGALVSAEQWMKEADELINTMDAELQGIDDED